MRTARLPSLDPNVTKCAVSSVGVGSSHDGTVTSTQTKWWSSNANPPAADADLNAWPAPFDKPFYVLINLAVGGNFDGNPDATTADKGEMVIDYIRAGEAQFEAARNAGFTTVLTVGRTGIFNGQSAVIDLAGDSVSEMTIRSPFAEHFTFTTVGGGQYPGSLLGTFSALRQMLLDAQRLQKLQKQYAANPRGMKRPDPDRSLEALFPIVNRQMPLVFNANSENEINRSLDLAKEFNIRAIIAGGTEAWKRFVSKAV